MHLLNVGGLPLPEVYICRSQQEARDIMSHGLSCIITELDDIDIVKAILYRTLCQKFRHIRWDKVLGYEAEENSHQLMVWVPGTHADEGDADNDGCIDVGGDHGEDDDSAADIARDRRLFAGESHRKGTIEYDVDDFFHDSVAHVNIEQLQALKMLPKFMDDIASAIRFNLENRMQWRDCWNKKLGACVGDFDIGSELPNLIILDISGSIPNGISGTMLSLIATLKEQANAELIITGGTSMYWGREDELPTPKWIRKNIPRANESYAFNRILREHIAGRRFGTVISFGDNDEPYQQCEGDASNTADISAIMTTTVERVMNFHTWRSNDWTGYARWTRYTAKKPEVLFDNKWCKIMQ